MRKFESSQKMKANPNRLIPIKPVENLLELLIVEHLLLITYFGKPLIDLTLTFSSEKQD